MPADSKSPFGPGVTLPNQLNSNTGASSALVPLAPDVDTTFLDVLPESIAHQLTIEQRDGLLEYGKGIQYGFTSQAAPMICRDEKCHPAGTKILTSNGEKQIEDLSEQDLIIGWEQSTQAIVGGFKNGNIKGYSFSLHSRHYSGVVHRIEVDDKSHVVTPEHYSIVKWGEKSHDAFAVYLMQKGDFWRIGKTQLFGHRGLFSPAARARVEKADKLWILGVYKTNTEALLAEEYFSTTGKISKALFIATKEGLSEERCNGLYIGVTQEQLDEHHLSMQKPQSYYASFLNSIGLNVSLPIWENGKKAFSDTGTNRSLDKNCIITINAINIVDGFMMVPCYPKKLQEHKYLHYPTLWKDAIITTEEYTGSVYSLNVDKHHTYFAEMIATHNCPFFDKCPLVANAIPRAFNKECPVERAQITSWTHTFSVAASIDATDPAFAYDMLLIDQIVFQMLLEARSAWQLALDPKIERRYVTGFNPLGQPFYTTEVAKAAEFYERLVKTKLRLLKELLATRKAKADAESKGYADPSRVAANLMSRAKKMRSVTQRSDGTTEALEIDIEDTYNSSEAHDDGVSPPQAPPVPGEIIDVDINDP